MVKRTTTLITGSIKRCKSIGSKVGVMDKLAQDLDRILAEFKASSDDMAVIEATGGFMLSGARMRAGSPSIVTATPTIIAHDLATDFDDATWIDRVADNTILTVPTGITRVNVLVGVEWDISAVGDRKHELLKNGTEVVARVRFCATSGGTVAFTPITSGPIDVIAGDTFSHRVTQTSGGNLLLFGPFMSAFALAA